MRFSFKNHLKFTLQATHTHSHRNRERLWFSNYESVLFSWIYLDFENSTQPSRLYVRRISTPKNSLSSLWKELTFWMIKLIIGYDPFVMLSLQHVPNKTGFFVSPWSYWWRNIANCEGSVTSYQISSYLTERLTWGSMDKELWASIHTIWPFMTRVNTFGLRFRQKIGQDALLARYW